MTDIVGFTELTRQAKTFVSEIGKRYRQILQESVSQHEGRIINVFGDAALVLFEVPLETLKCSLEIQRSVRQEPAIPLRIALHYGEVISEGDEVYGEAINLTSRILKTAVPSSILISDSLQALLQDKSSLQTRSIGIFNYKYVKRPVEVFGICEEDLLLPGVPEEEKSGTVQTNSIAVMPFINLTGEAGNDYLGDGIGEAIINVLARFSGLHVTARSSSFALRSQEKDVRELGRILGVTYLLEGSVQKHENSIRITAQLINTRTGFHIFSETYDQELIDLFSIQEDIAWRIAERLKEKINLEDKDQLASPRTGNVKALDYYMQARHLMARNSYSEVIRAIGLFRQSIEIDPGFVLPYTGICLCYTFLGALRMMDEDQANRKASQYALKALQIDPDLPEALSVQALSSFWINNWNLINAEEVIGKALRIAPGSAEIRLFHGMFILMAGHLEEAQIEVLLANKLDPLNPAILSRLGYIYLCMKNYEEAHTCFRLAHDTAPFALYIHYMLAWSYLLQKQYRKAESALQRVDEEKDVYQSVHGTRGYLHTKQGRLDQAYQEIQQIHTLNEQGQIRFPHYNLALIYAGLDKQDELFYHLEKAFIEKPVHLMFFQADPFWEKYRKERRFQDLAGRVFRRSASSRKIRLHTETKETLTLQSDQILYVEAQDNYSRVVWTEGNNRKEKLLRTTIKKLEEQLSGTDILRCHRSYLVNCTRYSICGDSRGFTLKSAVDIFEVPVSRQRSKEIIKRYRE